MPPYTESQIEEALAHFSRPQSFVGHSKDAKRGRVLASAVRSLRKELAAARGISEGRLAVLLQKEEECRREWTRAERAESDLARMREAVENHERFKTVCTAYGHDERWCAHCSSMDDGIAQFAHYLSALTPSVNREKKECACQFCPCEKWDKCSICKGTGKQVFPKCAKEKDDGRTSL